MLLLDGVHPKPKLTAVTPKTLRGKVVPYLCENVLIFIKG